MHREKRPEGDAGNQEYDVPEVLACRIERLEEIEVIVDRYDEGGHYDKSPSHVGIPGTVRPEPVEKKEQEEDEPEIGMKRNP